MEQLVEGTEDREMNDDLDGEYHRSPSIARDFRGGQSDVARSYELGRMQD
jgi:hypothetical protein